MVEPEPGRWNERRWRAWKLDCPGERRQTHSNMAATLRGWREAFELLLEAIVSLKVSAMRRLRRGRKPIVNVKHETVDQMTAFNRAEETSIAR